MEEASIISEDCFIMHYKKILYFETIHILLFSFLSKLNVSLIIILECKFKTFRMNYLKQNLWIRDRNMLRFDMLFTIFRTKINLHFYPLSLIMLKSLSLTMGVISLCSLNDQFTKFCSEVLFKFLYVFPNWNYPYKMITFFPLNAHMLIPSLIVLFTWTKFKQQC